jgi:putative restriction endonuclease
MLPEQAESGRRETTIQRIIRNTAVAMGVKELHGYCCQVCGVSLQFAGGLYAEGAHIRPLGRPHNGPDVTENILCLCPNHHVLFDDGAFGVADDFSLIGIEGRLRTVTGHTPGPTYLAYHREHYLRIEPAA